MNNSSSMAGVEILPTVNYPPTIRGSLRLILQLKDAFLGCFNLVEEYRDQLLACKHGFARDLVVYQLTKGLSAINRLREDLAYVESQARSRANRNKHLRNYLINRYNQPDALDNSGAPLGIVSRVGQKDGGGSALIGNAIPPPISAPDPVDQALHGGLDHFKGTVDVDELDVPEEINLATTLTEGGTHLKPVVEFYRSLYFLQMHFQLIMCQAANYALPVVTRPMTVSERAFAWPAMPSYGMASNTGAMKDRLLEIHSDVVSLAAKLHECLALVRAKMYQDKKIESYFMRHTAAQEALQGHLLRGLQAQRVYIDSLECQNDRLAGLAIKLDPNFAKSTDFAMMTGPGVGLPDEDDANQNSALPDHRRGGPKDPRNDGTGGGGLMDFNQHHSTKGYDNRNHPVDKSRRNNEGGKGGYEIHDTNVSATGRGQPPAVWIQQSTDPDQTLKKYPEGFGKTEMELNRKVNKLKGHSQAVEELLIGVDSVTSGLGRFTTDADQLVTPDFMNTDQYITSMYDEVFGQIPTSKSSKKPIRSTTNKSRVLTDCQNVRTPSTNYTQAKPLSPTLSVKNSIITVSDAQRNETLDDTSRDETVNQSERRIKNDAVNIHHENSERYGITRRSHVASPDMIRAYDSPENTTSDELSLARHLDTNVNSSHVCLPKLHPNSRHPLSRIARTAQSSPPTRRVRKENEFPEITKGLSSPTEDQFDSKLLHEADDAAHFQQVALVGASECGHLCMPDWVAKRAVTRIHKPEDLLQEPKRSAFNKAMIAHRCRLVETILQADEERLEEIISLLLKE